MWCCWEAQRDDQLNEGKYGEFMKNVISHVKVLSYTIKKDEKNEKHEFVSYYIKVFAKKGTQEWNIYRRYSQFRAFHLQLCTFETIQEELPMFPAKYWTGHRNPNKIKARMHALNRYLEGIVAIPGVLQSSVFKVFFGAQAELNNSTITEFGWSHRSGQL